MRTAVVMLAVMLLTGTEQGAPEPPVAIARTFAEWKSALGAGDVDALANLVTEDAVFWTHGVEETRGRDALKEAFSRLFDEYSVEQDWQTLERFQSDTFVVERAIETNHLRRKSDGARFEIRQRAFSVLVKGNDGRWRFARGMTNLGPNAVRQLDAEEVK